MKAENPMWTDERLNALQRAVDVAVRNIVEAADRGVSPVDMQKLGMMLEDTLNQWVWAINPSDCE